MKLKILTTVNSLLFKILSCSPHANWDNIERNFTHDNWKFGNRTERGKMIDHLVYDRLLLGKTIPEITEMLGLPDSQQNLRFNYAIISDSDNLDKHLSIEFEETENTVKSVVLID